MNGVLNINYHDFKAWLRTFPLGTRVGVSGSTESCPIYNFLHRKTDIPVLAVMGKFIYTKRVNPFPVVPHPLPEWVVEFIRRVDLIGGEKYVKVLAYQALDILFEMEQENSNDTAY